MSEKIDSDSEKIPQANLPFEAIKDQNSAKQEQWYNPLDIPNEECEFVLPAGTIVRNRRDDGLFVRLQNALPVNIEKKEDTNYDNKRVASSPDNMYSFEVKGKFLGGKQ